MKRGSWHKRFFIVMSLTGILYFAAPIVFVGLAYSQEDIDANCYIKGDDAYVYVGNIDVFNMSQAANRCNGTYIECEGKCIGCYTSDDGTEYCYDNSGRKFKK